MASSSKAIELAVVGVIFTAVLGSQMAMANKAIAAKELEFKSREFKDDIYLVSKFENGQMIKDFGARHTVSFPTESEVKVAFRQKSYTYDLDVPVQNPENRIESEEVCIKKQDGGVGVYDAEKC